MPCSKIQQTFAEASKVNHMSIDKWIAYEQLEVQLKNIDKNSETIVLSFSGLVMQL